ncbi:MAG: NADH-quinone oxidoreductase subunit L [Planctomycetota bacterium]|nr:NADH-quinone oxidoreductase subunit L [Planctomycetota bacterium]
MLEMLAWAIPVAPLVGCLVCTILAFQGDRDWAHWPAVMALAVSAICTLALVATFSDESGAAVVHGYTWLDIGSLRLDVSLRLDSLCLTLLSVVTVVSCLVAIYSREYMRGDPGYARFFAVFSGFVFCMTMLVMANNLLLLYAFWEGVGTCSYLLIGYYYRKPSAAKAAVKAFLVNRVADCGFLLGILLLSYAIGQTTVGAGASVVGRLDFATIFASSQELFNKFPELVGWIAFLLVIGAIGKSAQFPLHVWLPDAMEGPTPVSALIHAATMVTAGVYLMARMAPLMVYAPDVLVTLAWLGAITSIAAAVMAMFQYDLKRVLAYSTASQLGYLFMALGCIAVPDMMTIAVMAAMFHLFTHAFFKALLFLSAGNVMHAMGDVIDMRYFSGLRKILPKTNILFGIGAAALAGLPPFAAFFSKDTILSLLSDASADTDYGGHFTGLMVVGFLTAFLTAIYTSKTYFHTFWGKEVTPPEAGDHPHEATTIMLLPMVILAVGAILAGLALGPTGWILHYIAKTPGMDALHGEHHEAMWVLVTSTLVALIGVGIGYKLAQASTANSKAVSNDFVTAIGDFGRNRLYIDSIYQALIVTPSEWFAKWLGWFDETVVDGLTQLIGQLPGFVGLLLKRFQTGMVSSYAMVTACGIAALALWIATQ